MYGVDYGQAVDVELDDRLDGLQEIKDKLEDLMDAVKASKNADDYEQLYYDALDWVEHVNADIESVESKIDGQLNDVSSRWCD